MITTETKKTSSTISSTRIPILRITPETTQTIVTGMTSFMIPPFTLIPTLITQRSFCLPTPKMTIKGSTTILTIPKTISELILLSII